jgi:GGDEF domain-containing protein
MAVLSNGFQEKTRPERQTRLPRPVTLTALLAVYAAIVAVASADFGRTALLTAGLAPAALFALYALLLERAARAHVTANHDGLDFDIRERLSAYDPAAVAFAQSYVRTRLDEEIRRSQRYSLPLSVVVISLDMSRRAEADLASLTTSVVRIASSLMRAEDIVGHLGGFEYVFCLPHTSAEGAKVVFERLMDELSPYAPSAGMAVLEPDSVATGASMLKTAREDAARRGISQATSRIRDQLAQVG